MCFSFGICEENIYKIFCTHTKTQQANFDDADIIVSESDRGGGPLVHACAYRYAFVCVGVYYC